MNVSHNRARLFARIAVALACIACADAQTLTKLYDFPTAANAALTGAGLNPYDTPVLIGNELWFTTQKGGTTNFGTITKYNIVTNTVTTVLNTMDNSTGNTPQSSFVVAGNNLYYTTTRGGTGDKGTIDVYNIATQTNTTLYSSPSQTSGLPNTFPGNVAYVDLGNGKASIYAMEQNGGTSPAAGGMVKLTLDIATHTVTDSSLLYAFPGGAMHGRQPWKGIIQVGNNLYFTMATGGPLTTTGAPNGPGGIGVLNLANDSVNDALAFFPNTDGAYALGFHNPTYDATRNALFIGTNGTSARPGGLLEFNLATNSFTTLYELSAADPNSGLFPDGRFIDGPITVLGDRLFFTTRQGGTLNGGSIDTFDLTTNQFTKLYDLSATAGNNMGGGSWGGFTATQDASGYHLYITPYTGGLNNTGTIDRLDVTLVPEPSTTILLLGGGVFLMWRKRPAIRPSGVTQGA